MKRPDLLARKKHRAQQLAKRCAQGFALVPRCERLPRWARYVLTGKP